MITLFNRETIYTGTDVNTFSSIQRLLDAHRIQYDYRIDRRQGIIGMPTMHIYELYVRKKDVDEVMYLIHQQNGGAR